MFFLGLVIKYFMLNEIIVIGREMLYEVKKKVINFII